MKNKKRPQIQEGVEVDHAFLNSFMSAAMKDPRKFYSLLLLSGMKGTEAYRIIYNLKHPRIATSSFQTKMRMLSLLRNIIELITKDRIMYSRLRSLAMSGDLEHFGKNVTDKKAYRNRPSNKKKNMMEDTSVGAGGIEGIPPTTPADQTSGLMAKLGKMFRRLKKPNGKPTGGGPPNFINLDQ